jgi:hypothetical protein
MIVAERAGLAAGFGQQRSWTHNAASERRGHPKGRSEKRRSRLQGGLTATG